MSDPLKIVDAHHHLWDLDKNYYPWLSDTPEPHFFLGNYDALKENFMPDDYRAETAGYTVVATVHVDAEWDRNAQVAETKWLHEVAAEHGMPNAVVGHVWLAKENCEEVLAGHFEYPMMRGVRSKPITSVTAGEKDSVKGRPGSLQDPNWLAGYALLRKYDLTYDLRVPHWHLPEAADAVAQFPETPVVLNHTGFPWDRSAEGLKAWRENMRIIAEVPHVSVKISEHGVKDAPWDDDDNRRVIREAIEIFGFDRCMFASNLPVCRLRAGFSTVVECVKSAVADATPEEREKLFSRNAAAFYRIDIG